MEIALLAQRVPAAYVSTVERASMLRAQGKWSAQPAGRARTCLEALNAPRIVIGVSLGRTRSQEALSVYHVLLGHTRHLMNRRRARYAPTVKARRQEAPPRAISVSRVLLGRTQQNMDRRPARLAMPVLCVDSVLVGRTLRLRDRRTARHAPPV